MLPIFWNTLYVFLIYVNGHICPLISACKCVLVSAPIIRSFPAGVWQTMEGMRYCPKNAVLIFLRHPVRFPDICMAIYVLVNVCLRVHPSSRVSLQACGKKLYNRGLQRMEAMLYAMDRSEEARTKTIAITNIAKTMTKNIFSTAGRGWCEQNNY